jgi:putative ABC transport system permease protein
MTSADLALRNVKKSVRDYTVYFLTLTFGVCIFYIFNALDSQQAMMEISSSQSRIFRELTQIMNGISVFVSLILGFLILYANRFLIRRRKKEFGVYMTLGMERGQISRILVMETVLVGLLSLLFGLVTGVFLSQGMSVLTAKLMNARLTGYHFVFSPAAALKTIVYFGLIFLLVLIFNAITIGKQKLISLIYANKKNEWFKTPRLWLSVIVFLTALGCLGLAYRMVLSGGAAEFLDGSTLSIAVALGIAGTFLFFFSLSGFFLKLVQLSKKIYLKNLNMFILRQINSKINTAYASMTMVCLMLFISICTLSSGLGLSADIAGAAKKNSPFDATLSVHVTQGGVGEAATTYPGFDLPAALAGNGVDLNTFAEEYLTVRYYDAGGTVPLTVKENNVVTEMVVDTYLLKLSDYNAALAMQDVAPISLDADEYAVNYAVTNNAFSSAMQAYMRGSDAITLGGTVLRAKSSNLYTYTMEVLINQDYTVMVVVPDAVTEGLPAIRDVLHVNYPQETDVYEKLCKESLSSPRWTDSVESSLQTKMDVREYNDSATTLVSYLAVYLGIVFLLASAAVLAIGQLSEVSDNVGRYSLLRKIGTEDKMLYKALFAQILIYFGTPMLLAAVHSAVGISVASRLVSAFDKGEILGASLIVAAIFMTVYGGYFLATYLGSKGILNRDYAQQHKGAE